MINENHSGNGKADPSPGASGLAAGTNGRSAASLAAFQDPGRSAGPGAGRTPPPLPKNKGGRPRNDGRPPGSGPSVSKEAREAGMSDAEMEAAKAEFEASLVYVIFAFTDEKAESSYEILKAKYPEDVARGKADKWKLTDMERKVGGPLITRIYRKYVGDNFKYSDEMLAAVMVGKYYLRTAGTASDEKACLKLITPENGNAKQPGLQSTVTSNSGGKENG